MAYLGTFDVSILLDVIEKFCIITFHGTTPCHITNLLKQIRCSWISLRDIFPIFKTLP